MLLTAISTALGLAAFSVTGGFGTSSTHFAYPVRNKDYYDSERFLITEIDDFENDDSDFIGSVLHYEFDTALDMDLGQTYNVDFVYRGFEIVQVPMPNNTYRNQLMLDFTINVSQPSNLYFYFVFFDDDDSSYFVSNSNYYLTESSLINTQTNYYTFSGKSAVGMWQSSRLGHLFSLEIHWCLLDDTFYESMTGDYQTGYNNGYYSGYKEGKTDGFNGGYSTGKTEGYTDGYNNGYNNGVQSVVSDYGFMDLFGSIADTPILMFRSLFNFDLFGVPVITVLLSLFTSLFLVFFIKKLIK